MALTLKHIQDTIYIAYKQHGYEKNWNDSGKIGDIAKLGLIITEVSEAIEEIRKPNMNSKNLAFECADIIIRVLNFASRKNINCEIAIKEKHKINMKRGFLHGKDV